MMYPIDHNRPTAGYCGDLTWGSRLAANRAARARQRRRRAIAVALLLVAAMLVGVDLVQHQAGPAGSRSAVAAAEPGGGSAGQVDEPGVADESPTGAGYPATGPGTFRYATGSGPILGTAGTVRRYQVAVEDGLGPEPIAFAASVDEILGDERGWTASKKLRLQRVPKTTDAEFIVYLASPGTTEKMCAAGGLHTEKFNSCRLPGRLLINVARWLTAVPDYDAPLAVYQAYAINHELGHQLGQGHEACPGPGAPAPVMQQQTYGRKGCVANAWPYLDGQRHAGPVVP